MTNGVGGIRQPASRLGPVDAVIFDHDGTLVDSLAVVVAATNETLVAFGYAEHPAPAIVAGMVHATAIRLGLHAEVDDPPVRQQMADAYNAAALRCAHLARLYPGVAPLLASLAARQVPQAIVSNSEGAFIRTVLTRLGVASHFGCLIGEDDMPAPKPDPRGLLAAVKRLGSTPTRALYVGDSRADVETARAADLRVVGVTWGTHTREELRSLGFDALVDSPAELQDLLEIFG